MRTMCKTRWFLPLFSVALGGVMLAAWTIGGHLDDGFVGLGIMTAFGAVFAFGGRSETIRGLRGDGSDERFRQIDVHATAFAGTVVVIAIIIAFAVSLAEGHDGGPYTWLGAVAGFSYMAAIVRLRIRG